MPVDDPAAIAGLLPGRWIVKATNFPLWLGDRRDATFEYELLRDQPLTLSDTVSYVDPDGKPKTLRGTSRWVGDGFARRARGSRGLLGTSRWEVAGARPGLVVLRFEQSVANPAALDVVVPEGADAHELRSTVAADPAAFGLAVEEFASLTWLDHLPPSA
ncbi:MAG: hypothetical protein ACTHKX_07640 [Pseudolysinimonas sp.]